MTAAVGVGGWGGDGKGVSAAPTVQGRDSFP